MACLASSNSRGLPVMPEIVPVVPRTAAVAPAAVVPAAVAPAAVAPTTIAPATVAPTAIAPAYTEMKIGPFGGEGGGIGVHGNTGVLEIDLGDGGANFAQAVGDTGDVVVGLKVGRSRFRGGGRQGGRHSQNAGGKKHCECLQSTETHRHSRSPRM